jgi:Aspartyl protease
VRKQGNLAASFLFCALLACAQADAAEESGANAVHLINEGTTSRVPVRIYRDFLVIAEGQFGSALRRQNFILDTGSSPSIVNTRVAKELGLVTDAWVVNAAGKSVPTETAILPEVELGPVRAVSVRVQVHDLSRLERDLGFPVAAIVGLDVLSRASFRLDYAKKRIDFGEVSDEGLPVAVDAHTGMALARATVDGKPVRLLVDTGADRVALLGGNFAGPVSFAVRKTSQQGWGLADPNIAVEVLAAPDIALDGQHFAVKKAYVIRGGTAAAFDGFLGVRALGFRAVAYDHVRAMLYLQK